MSDLLPFIIIGVVSGSVYGLAAVGLVLSYRTSGIFNFAHGALATLSAYVFYALHIAGNVSWPIAAIISVLILGPALGIGFERYARVLSRASLIMQVAGTVGVLLVPSLTSASSGELSPARNATALASAPSGTNANPAACRRNLMDAELIT